MAKTVTIQYTREQQANYIKRLINEVTTTRNGAAIVWVQDAEILRAIEQTLKEKEVDNG